MSDGSVRSKMKTAMVTAAGLMVPSAAADAQRREQARAAALQAVAQGGRHGLEELQRFAAVHGRHGLEALQRFAAVHGRDGMEALQRLTTVHGREGLEALLRLITIGRPGLEELQRLASAEGRNGLKGVLQGLRTRAVEQGKNGLFGLRERFAGLRPQRDVDVDVFDRSGVSPPGAAPSATPSVRPTVIASSELPAGATLAGAAGAARPVFDEHPAAPVTPAPRREPVFQTRELNGPARSAGTQVLPAVRDVEPSRWRELGFVDAPVQPATQRLVEEVMRPYQRLVHERLKVGTPSERAAQVVNLPTGTGKTLVGMGYVGEALARARPGSSVLVLAPSSIVAQQWRDGLVYSDRGLKLPASRVFSGSPAELVRHGQLHAGQARPAVVVMTPAGIERLSRTGGLDDFLTNLEVSNVVVDELHHMVSDSKAPQYRLVEQLVDRARSGRLDGVLGLSATTDAVSENIDKLGLTRSVHLPPEAMIHTGYVPPYDVHGVVSTLSSSEAEIQRALSSLRDDASKLLGLLDTPALRERFASLARHHRPVLVEVFANNLGKYASKSPGAQATEIEARIGKLLGGDVSLGRNQMDLLLAVQAFDGESDASLVAKYGKPGATEAWQALEGKAAEARAVLAQHIEVPEYRALFDGEFGQRVSRLGPAVGDARQARAKNLGQTLGGTVEGMRSYWRNFGAGTSEAVTTLHREEQRARKASGSRSPLSTLVFADAQAVAIPRGSKESVTFAPASVPGLMLEGSLLDGDRTTGIGLQSGHAFLPERGGLRQRIVDEVLFKEILGTEVSKALVDELCAELPWASEAERAAHEPLLRERAGAAVQAHLDHLQGGGSRGGPRALLSRVRTSVRSAGLPTPVTSALEQRLASPARSGLAGPLKDMTEWLRVGRRLTGAPVHTGRALNGKTLDFAMVNLGTGRARQLSRMLFARAVDAGPRVGIDTVALSDGWAVGTDMRRPAVVIMAKRVDGESSFRQRLGRGLRSSPDWAPWHAELLGKLIGSPEISRQALGDVAPRELSKLLEHARPTRPSQARLTEQERTLLVELLTASKASPALLDSVKAGTLRGLGTEARLELAAQLLANQNKVARVYEVYDYKPGGSDPNLATQGDILRRTPANARKYDAILLPAAESGLVQPGEDQARILNPSTATGPAELAARVRQLPTPPTVAANWLRALRLPL